MADNKELLFAKLKNNLCNNYLNYFMDILTIVLEKDRYQEQIENYNSENIDYFFNAFIDDDETQEEGFIDDFDKIISKELFLFYDEISEDLEPCLITTAEDACVFILK
jgi:hypothetical protein